MALKLPPFRWPLNIRDWEIVYRKITEAAALLWSQIDKSGASLGDLPNRAHSLLTDILGWTSGTGTDKDKHISQAQGKKWEDHADLSNNTHHGLDHDARYFITEYQTGTSIPTGKRFKIIKYADGTFDWEEVA